MLSPRDLPLLPVFVTVANLGSFTAAARELRLAKSVVSQHVRTLEARCGVRLMERSTRRLHLTQIGEHVLEAAQEVLGSIRSLERVVEGHRDEPTGTLRVTAPSDHGFSAMLGPIATELLRRYPSLRVDLVFDDDLRDLLQEGLDIALRVGPIAESSYVVRRLGYTREIIVASPSVIDLWGDVGEPRDLLGAPWIAHKGVGLRPGWTFRSEAGDKVRISVDLRGTVNTTGPLQELLLAGAGFGIMPEYLVRDDLLAGRLRQVCPGWYRRRVPFHALLPTRHGPPRVRLFLSALAESAKAFGFGS